MKLDARLLDRTRLSRLSLGLSISLGLLGGVVTVGQAWLLSRAISRVFLGGEGLPGVGTLLLLFLLLSFVRAGLTWGAAVVAHQTADRVKQDLRSRLVARLLELGPIYARGERSGELTNTLVEGVEALDAYFRQYLPQLALAALVPLTVFLFVLPLDWISALVLLLTAPLLPLFMVLIGSAADALTHRQWASLSRMSAHFLDVLQGLSTLKHLGRSREQIQAIARVSDRFRQTTMGVLRIAFLSALVLEMVATISTAIVAVQVGLRLLYGHLPFEQAFFVLLLAPEFYLPLRLLGTRFHAGIEGVAAAERVFDVLDTLPPQANMAGEPQAATPEAAGALHPRGLAAVHFHDVHATYGDRERPALLGVSFQLAPGEKLAVVGPSGAGKTTIAYLLLRFMEPSSGAITVGDTPLSSIPAEDWRALVSWVPQNPYLFQGTVAENIRLARPGATMDEVAWAARQAHAQSFIEALPAGYDTLVGERGARLSGGEAQRLALARAFLKDSPYLILDEATANLDPEAESLVQDALARLLRSRTALIIAHRLHTVYRADRILVLEGGRIVEEGQHQELIQREGLYRRLARAYVPGGSP